MTPKETIERMQVASMMNVYFTMDYEVELLKDTIRKCIRDYKINDENRQLLKTLFTRWGGVTSRALSDLDALRRDGRKTADV